MKIYIGRPPEVVAAVAAQAAADPVSSLGAWFLGTMFVVFSLGMLASQASTYYNTFPKDNRWLKSLVAITIALSLAQFGVVFAVAWQWFVTSYGDWKTVVAVPWCLAIEPIIAHLNVIVPQMFFAYRCFVLTGRNWYLFIGLISLMITALILFTIMSVQLGLDPYYYSLMDPVKRLTTPGLIITIFVDCAITGLMTWKLIKSKKGFNPNTDSGLNKLLAVTWEAAALPAAVAITSLAVFIGVSDRPILYTLFNILVPRLYVFSMMFTLNSRASLKEIFNGSGKGTTSISMSNMSKARPTPQSQNANFSLTKGGGYNSTRAYDPTRSTPTAGMEVQVEVNQWQVHDDDASDDIDLKSKVWSGNGSAADVEKRGQL